MFKGHRGSHQPITLYGCSCKGVLTALSAAPIVFSTQKLREAVQTWQEVSTALQILHCLFIDSDK